MLQYSDINIFIHRLILIFTDFHFISQYDQQYGQPMQPMYAPQGGYPPPQQYPQYPPQGYPPQEYPPQGYPPPQYAPQPEYVQYSVPPVVPAPTHHHSDSDMFPEKPVYRDLFFAILFLIHLGAGMPH